MFARAPRGVLWVAAASLALLTVVRLYRPPLVASTADAAQRVPLATPPGITLQLRAGARRTRVAADAEWLYADSRGMSLYTSDAVNARGPAACSGECAAQWHAALAPRSSIAQGDWAVLARADGSRQWAFQGSPLYLFGNDNTIGETAGDGAGGGVWHAAVLSPGAGMALPDGVRVRSIPDAGGAGLADPEGMTLYTSSGGAAPGAPLCTVPDCARHWIALEAPAIANAVGDFSARARPDGIAQWTYRGRALYAYDRDRNPGDVNGTSANADMSPALVASFFMPSDTALHRTLELGTILATRSGATLYQLDRVATAAELHPFRTDHGSPALGRALGSAACDANCTKAWPPFGAPADAQPTGYWDIYMRPEGTRQWAYKGFALYTHTADKPGEFSGNAIYTLDPIGSESTRADPPIPPSAPGIGLGATFWHAVVP